MKLSLFVTAALLSTVILISCNKDNPVPPGEQPQINLTLEDVSCTEAWLKLTTANITLPADVELLKDDIHSETISLTSADTILYIDSLLPNKTYTLSSIVQSNNPPAGEAGQSIKVSVPVSTMDTTSHNFTWQTWTFGGEAGSCTLYDCAIISPDNIWCVGEIYLLDSLGQPDPIPYNAVHWDGNEWETIRIYFPTVCGNTDSISYPATTIFKFNDNQIWVSTGDKMAIIQDGLQIKKFCLPSAASMTIYNLWGTSNSDFYIVGYAGSIAHYQNGQWTRIESGTELNINDIWGYSDGSGNNLILCAASDLGTNHQKKLLRINGNSVDTLDWSPQKTLFTIWLPSIRKIYVGGGKTYAKCGNDWIEQTSVNFFTYGIRGNDFNEVYAVGGGHFSHFNGYTWKEIPELFLSGGNYEGVATKGGITCSVGYLGNKAIAAIITK